ncbi:hypothetical protein P7K49_030204 [Saguinus oedipus]|uniref:Uncharacterized protein n=1 Tax=Saguinus oedipus TaxID=9490 RepID=A0ABQ9U1H2_SAGOE|nr:hypothetical protein P7K49_030204 [Saguinus oedipus]
MWRVARWGGAETLSAPGSTSPAPASATQSGSERRRGNLEAGLGARRPHRAPSDLGTFGEASRGPLTSRRPGLRPARAKPQARKGPGGSALTRLSRQERGHLRGAGPPQRRPLPIWFWLGRDALAPSALFGLASRFPLARQPGYGWGRGPRSLQAERAASAG